MMRWTQHQGVRTALTLEPDVAAKLKVEARRSGRSFKDIVNDTLRRGLASGRGSTRRVAFRVEARDLGNLKPGLSLESVADLLDQLESPLHR